MITHPYSPFCLTPTANPSMPSPAPLSPLPYQWLALPDWLHQPLPEHLHILSSDRLATGRRTDSFRLCWTSGCDDFVCLDFASKNRQTCRKDESGQLFFLCHLIILLNRFMTKFLFNSAILLPDHFCQGILSKK